MASLLSYSFTSDGKLTCVMKTFALRGQEVSLPGSTEIEGVVGGNLAINGMWGLIPAGALPPSSLALTKSCSCVGYEILHEVKEKLTFEACSNDADDPSSASLRAQSTCLGHPHPPNGAYSDVRSLDERENKLPHSGDGILPEHQSKPAWMNYRRKNHPKEGSNINKKPQNGVSPAPLSQPDIPPPVCTTPTTCTSSSPSPPPVPLSLNPGPFPVLSENGLSTVTIEAPFPTVDEIENCISEDLSSYFERICLFLARNKCNLVSVCVDG